MRNFIVCAALIVLGMASALPCMAANSENLENVINVDNQDARASFLGYLYAISVEESGAMLIITAPAPNEPMLGVSPASEWTINGSGQLVIKVKKFILDGGTMMEVAVKLSNGDTGIYYLTWG